jgi:hypothetical protein
MVAVSRVAIRLLWRVAAGAALGAVLGTMAIEWVRDDYNGLRVVAFVFVAFVSLPGVAAVLLTIPSFHAGTGALLGATVALAPLLVDFVPWLIDPHYIWDVSLQTHVVWGATAVMLALTPGAAAGFIACALASLVTRQGGGQVPRTQRSVSRRQLGRPPTLGPGESPANGSSGCLRNLSVSSGQHHNTRLATND